MKILIVDNYDSFTYNLLHLVEKVAKADIEVHRNDKLTLKQANSFDKIIFSPGPGLPSDIKLMGQIIEEYKSSKSILGVCLGHQAIAESFGGHLVNLESVFHGISTEIRVIKEDFLFKKIPKKFHVGRYHSWIVDAMKLPNCVEITAIDDNNTIMALRHKEYDIRGVQFHPESILTEYGEQLIKNWVQR